MSRAPIRLALAASALFLANCGNPYPGAAEISRPFYLMTIEDPHEQSLFRCLPDGGCAGDGLPGPYVYAGGADRHYVVVAQHPRRGDFVDLTHTSYFYFARVPEENGGWGNNPERIVGPLTRSQFEQATRDLRLPRLSVQREYPG